MCRNPLVSRPIELRCPCKFWSCINCAANLVRYNSRCPVCVYKFDFVDDPIDNRIVIRAIDLPRILNNLEVISRARRLMQLRQ